MLTLACFDPYTLSIVIDYGLLSQALPAELVSVAYDAGVKTSAAAVAAIRAIDDPALRGRAIMIAAAIWHEKRHFFDYVLTGYGSNVVRGGLTQMMYAQTIVAAFARAQTELLVPIDRYANSATRAVLGLPAPPPEIAGLIAYLARARRTSAANTIAVDTQAGPMQLSGMTAIEALGFYAEVNAAIIAFGLDDYRAYFADLTATSTLNLRYRWADFVGSARSANVRGETLEYLDVTAISAALIAALAREGDVGAAFIAISSEMKTRGLFDRETSAAQAWAAVNEIARIHTGQTAVETLRASYAREAEAFERLPAFTRGIIGDLPERFHALRGRLIAMLESTPEQVIDMTEWTANVLPLLQPHYLLVYPGGVDAASVGAGFAPIWTASFPLPQGTASWCWALGQDPLQPVFPQVPEARTLEIGAFAQWTALADTVAPLAKLLANGRRQDVMFGPETDRSEHLVRESTPLQFDPAFARPPVWGVGEKRIFYHLHRATQLPCGRCGRPADVADAALLPSWEQRRLAKLRADAPLEAFMMHFRVWVPSILCARCFAVVSAEAP